MPKMSMCTCTIRVGNDVRTIIHRGETRPVTWPETEVLQAVHGENAVSDIVVFGTEESTNVKEKHRLELLYGTKVCDELFPGKRPAVELEAPAGIARKKTPRKAKAPATAPETPPAPKVE